LFPSSKAAPKITGSAYDKVRGRRGLMMLIAASSSVPDPDPLGSEIIWPQGSGSGSEIINFGSGSGSGSGSFPFSHQT